MAPLIPAGVPVPIPTPHRNLAIAGGVVLLHVAALWALQSGLVRRVVEVVVPVAVLTEVPPEPKVEPAPPAPPAPAPVQRPREPVRKAPAPAPRPVPRAPAPPPVQPLAVPDPAPAPNAPVGAATPLPPAPPIDTPVAAAPAPAAPAAPSGPSKVELPSSDADYLQNPKPPYPPLSKRLGEQGRVVVRVLIGADGQPQKAELAESSGYDRLDQAALTTVMKWRYVPGKRNGVPEAMWFRVPINFVLE